VASEADRRVAPSELLSALRQAVERRPMSSRGVALRVHSAQQVAASPPTFALRVNLAGEIHFSYERYLVNSLRRAFRLRGLTHPPALPQDPGKGKRGHAPRRASR